MSLLTERRAVLHEAIRADDIGAIQVLLADGVSPNLRDANGWPALVLAAQMNRYGCVRALLNAGADPKEVISRRAKTLRCVSVLHWGLTADVARALLEADADPNVPNEHQLTPLDIAVAAADAEYARLLLAHGAEVSDEMRTPQYWAGRGEKFEAVRRAIFSHLTVTSLESGMSDSPEGDGGPRRKGPEVSPL